MSVAVQAEKFAGKTRFQVSLFKSKYAIRFGASENYRKILVKFRCQCSKSNLQGESGAEKLSSRSPVFSKIAN
jgi:hypothetical protein